MSLSINPVDGIVVSAVLLSGILALIRGLVREMLSLASWTLAVIAGARFAPLLKPFMLKYTDNDMLASAGAGTIVFLIVLLTLTIISHLIARTVRNSGLSAVDRSLGFVFGAVRGFLVAALIYMAGTQIFTTKEYPDWLTEAKTEPALAKTSDWISAMMPGDLHGKLDASMKEAKESAKKAKQDKEELERLASPHPGRIDHKDETPVEQAVDQVKAVTGAASAVENPSVAPTPTAAKPTAPTHIRDNNGKQ